MCLTMCRSVYLTIIPDTCISYHPLQAWLVNEITGPIMVDAWALKTYIAQQIHVITSKSFKINWDIKVYPRSNSVTTFVIYQHINLKILYIGILLNKHVYLV